MKILKFGGTSIGTPECILNVVDIITASLFYNQVAVVVSALGGVTDQLISMANKASEKDRSYWDILNDLSRRHVKCVQALIEPKDREHVIGDILTLIKELDDLLLGVFLVNCLASQTLDQILSIGERLSATIISASLKSRQIEAEWLDARRIIITNDTFGAARVEIDVTYSNIQSHFQTHNNTQVITGFIAATTNGDTTTLGRSGSDYTASLIGAAIDAEVIEIWTDVNGVMTADPKKVPGAFSIPNLTFEEAMEMSHFGAKVIFPPTIQPVISKNIPILIRNSFQPEFEGTIINNHSDSKGLSITGFSSIKDIALIRVQGSGMIGVIGIIGRMFQAMAKKEISVFLVSLASSEHSICFAVEPNDARDAKEVIEKEFALEIQVNMIDTVKIERDLSIVAVVGENMRHTPPISGWIFNALGCNRINVVAIAQGSSERNISIVVAQEDETKAVRVLHDAFFDPAKRTLDLFIIGTGLVGSELLWLINKPRKDGVSLRVCGLANSRKMVFNADGISLNNWKKMLNQSGVSMDLERFVNEMETIRGSNPVFVDCTADESVARKYTDILAQSISIVTPNKIANTLEWKNYIDIRNVSATGRVKFLYEANVGAGLPIISTLKGFINSSDTVLKIEAVLSGTLSYLFNSFTGEKPFSDIVREAREKGYTEPDPQNDLNGKDVARKLLILVREIGYKYELEDIAVESLLPEGYDKFESTDVFLEKLKILDDDFEQKRLHAENHGQVLRYIASLKDGKVKVALKEVGVDHPFHSLSGSENIIAFTTKRYSQHPLVIRGPGAGAGVTAAGVLTDILSCP